METKQKIINELYSKNVNLVYYVYSTMIIKSPLVNRNKDDIIQEGLVGLWKACIKFNPDMGNSFSTFAIKTIKMTMLKYIYNLIHISNIECSYDTESYCKREGKAHTNKSKLNGLYEMVGNNSYELEEKEDEIFIEQILIDFPEKYVTVITLKKEGHTQSEIAEKINVSQMEVSRILNKIKKVVKIYL